MLDRQREEGETLLAERDQVVNQEDYSEWDGHRTRWVDVTSQALKSLYSNDEYVEEFQRTSNTPLVIGGAGVAKEFAWAGEALSRAVNKLRGFREGLEFVAASGDSAVASADVKDHLGESKIFVVHGHAHDVKESVTRLLEKTGSHEAIVLHEQPNAGRTLIEKFEDYASASDYAVVLLTADDVGGPRGEQSSSLNPRGRQNVVFELGFFVGRLGRSRVVVLFEEEIEQPSDFKGVVYIPLGDESWRYKLLQELRGAGLNFDLNKLPT